MGRTKKMGGKKDIIYELSLLKKDMDQGGVEFARIARQIDNIHTILGMLNDLKIEHQNICGKIKLVMDRQSEIMSKIDLNAEKIHSTEHKILSEVVKANENIKHSTENSVHSDKAKSQIDNNQEKRLTDQEDRLRQIEMRMYMIMGVITVGSFIISQFGAIKNILM